MPSTHGEGHSLSVAAADPVAFVTMGEKGYPLRMIQVALHPGVPADSPELEFDLKRVFQGL